MNPTTHLAVITEHHGRRSVLRLQGELDASNRDRLHSAVSSALENHPPLLVMDLSGLGFTDCAGLSVLVGAHKRLAGSGHRLVITGAKPAVQRLLHLTGLGTYLHLSTPEAISGNPDEGIYTLWGSITGSDLGGLLGWHHRWVIFSVVYLLARGLLGCVMVLARREVSKDAELLVLRHENAVLRRHTSRVRYQPGDRLWLAALSCGVPELGHGS